MHTDQMKSERIQKLLSRRGLGSRRQIEQWIRDKRIKVNGVVAGIGDRISCSDKVWLDKKQITINQKETSEPKVIIYHKPVGEICTRLDAKGRPTVFSKLPSLNGSRWISVGRLDINTSGLLLFTNDGELANRLMHPSANIDREYAVRVIGKVEPYMLRNIRRGLYLQCENKKIWAKFTDIVDSGGSGKNHWYHVALMSGRNHEVKRLWSSQGITVSRLMRVRFGPISLPRELPRGSIKHLDQDEIDTLLDWLENESKDGID